MYLVHIFPYSPSITHSITMFRNDLWVCISKYVFKTFAFIHGFRNMFHMICDWVGNHNVECVFKRSLMPAEMWKHILSESHQLLHTCIFSEYIFSNFKWNIHFQIGYSHVSTLMRCKSWKHHWCPLIARCTLKRLCIHLCHLIARCNLNTLAHHWCHLIARCNLTILACCCITFEVAGYTDAWWMKKYCPRVTLLCPSRIPKISVSPFNLNNLLKKNWTNGRPSPLTSNSYFNSADDITQHYKNWAPSNSCSAKFLTEKLTVRAGRLIE